VAWWQTVVTFVGIPAAIIAVITGVVLLTSHPRVPDGIAEALAKQAGATEKDPEPAEGSRDEVRLSPTAGRAKQTSPNEIDPSLPKDPLDGDGGAGLAPTPDATEAEDTQHRAT